MGIGVELLGEEKLEHLKSLYSNMSNLPDADRIFLVGEAAGGVLMAAEMVNLRSAGELTNEPATLGKAVSFMEKHKSAVMKDIMA